MPFQLRTNVFERAVIPKKFTCEGPDVSPAFEWTGAPIETACFALIMDDPDAPGGSWVHWVLYNIPPDELGLPEGLKKKLLLKNGAQQGRNDFGKIGYNGPCPPRGSEHRYVFKLYALDSKINLAPGTTKSQLEGAIRGHVLAQTDLIGKFQR